MSTAEVISVQLKDLKSYKGSNNSSIGMIDVTEDMVDEVMMKVEASLVNMYNSKKRPQWETRPLKIT